MLKYDDNAIYINCMDILKRADTRDKQLVLVWGFIKADYINFKIFKELLKSLELN